MKLSRRISAVPIRTKILVPITAIVLLAFVIIFWATASILESLRVQSSLLAAERVTESIEGGIVEAMISGNSGQIEDVLRNIVRGSDIRRVSLRRPDGSHYIDVGPGRGSPVSKPPDRPRGGPMVSKEVFSTDERLVRVTSELHNGPRCYRCHGDAGNTLGYLEVSVPGVWLKRKMLTSQHLIAAVAAATLILVWAAVSLTVHYAVLRRIGAFVRAMRDVRRGQRTVQVATVFDDELGKVGEAFNKMVADIARADARLVQQEQQLAKAEKLASIGLMAGGIAHEINNPLAATSMAAEMLESAGLTEDQRKRLTRSVVEGASRIQAIVSELLTLDRRQGLALQEIGLDSLVRNAIHSVDVPANIRVHFKLGQSLPPVRVDASKMARALGNIVHNAVKAMPEGGALTVAAEECKGGLCLLISDTGIGMTAEVAQQVFDPFFSTREVGEGFGLGLAVAHGTIIQHGADISVESEPGVGTTFRITFPVTGEVDQDA